MNSIELTLWLEKEWGEGGFLAKIRDGEFQPEDSEAFIRTLDAVDLSEEEYVPKKLIGLLCYLLVYLDWQIRFVNKLSGYGLEYRQFRSNVANTLEGLFQMP